MPPISGAPIPGARRPYARRATRAGHCPRVLGTAIPRPNRLTTSVGARELVFTYGDDGRLAKRALLDDDDGLIAFQTWAWDDAGRIVAHAITRARTAWETPRGSAGPFGALETLHRYERAFDADGRMVRDTEIQVGPTGAENRTERAWVFEGELLMSVANGDDETEYVTMTPSVSSWRSTTPRVMRNPRTPTRPPATLTTTRVVS